MSTFNIIVQPTNLAVSVAEMEDQLRADLTDETSLITAKIKTAIDYVENKSGRSLITQTCEMKFDKWQKFTLLRSPIQSITSIKYFDKDNVEHTVDSNLYFLDNQTIRLHYNKEYPSVDLREGESITVTYVTGYGDDSTDVPERYREAIKLLAAYYYENREAVIMPNGSGSISGQALHYGIDQLIRLARGF